MSASRFKGTHEGDPMFKSSLPEIWNFLMYEQSQLGVFFFWFPVICTFIVLLNKFQDYYSPEACEKRAREFEVILAVLVPLRRKQDAYLYQ
jgi:hypothetical protein